MFTTTLPIIFTYTHLFNVFELAVFLCAIFGLVYVYTPEPQQTLQDRAKKDWYKFLQSAWLGELALWRAFWPFFLFINAVLFYADYRIANVTYTIASWKTVHGMVFLPIIWWTVSVWRCSTHTRYKINGAAARTLTMFLFLELALRFFISSQLPSTLFDCRLLIMQYGDCL
ncbi:hypothetical protein [Methylovulum miyakonense]|uniref:hypothetical protein n=1 Tax=Methylovulum miyakonense TaxID=645578 RepID=UPI00035F029F|nr:hypothetical protein [Methylovulum miyakonense]